MSIEAMKQALEAMGLMGADLICEAAHHGKKDRHGIGEPCHIQQRWHKAFDALRTAIAEAEKQEPVAWANINKHGDITHTNNKRMPWSKTPLYTTPPAQPAKQKPVAWLGLEPSDMPDGDDPMYDHDFFLKGMAWADAILRKKNTTPPAAQRQWVGLTDDEIKEIIGPWGDTPIKGYTRKLFDQIEAKLKEKNT